MKLSDFVMRFVAQQGVRHVFLLVGGGAMHLNDSLARCQGLQYVCNHHEQASAIAAENYAKFTNQLGVAMVTTGPGGTNAITGLAGAWLDSTPCLFISGQVKRPDRMYDSEGKHRGVRQMGNQEIDIVAIVKPLTKYAVTIDDPNSIRYHMEKAVHLARTGRPGPVWIDIPIDVQGAQIDESSLPGFEPEATQESGGDDALSRQVCGIIEQLNKAERPLLMIGNGVRLAGAGPLLEETIRLLQLPVETTWVAMDLIGEDDPLFVGRPGTLAARGANFALQNCDFLLVIGARMDLPIVGYTPENMARAAFKVMVDIDAAELAKLGTVVQMPVQADAKAFLTELLAQRSNIAGRDYSGWLKRCQDWNSKYPLITAEHRVPNGLVSIFHLAEVIAAETSPQDCIVSGSSGSGIEIFLFAFPVRKGQRAFHTAGLGAMGYGIAASIGVCVASGGQRTICVDGDGGFQLNIQELATVAHLGLPIKFFVLNNNGYASIRASQTNFFGAPSIGCSEATGITMPNLLEIARSYGIAAVTIEDQSDLNASVRKVLDMPGPVICDVKVIPDEVRAPRLSSVQRADGSFVSKPLEDLWPFLERDEFAANMIVPLLPE
jgi:acetolactate synthase-1/2/3 large subunit